MMAVFDPRPNRPHSIQPGGRQAAPYTPVVLFDRGRLLAAIGAPGGRRIPTAIAQVVSNMVDHGMDIQDAIAAPRIHSESARIEIDDRFPPSVIEGLRAIGHDVAIAEKTVCSYNFANPVGVMVDPNGMLLSGTDPMLPSAAVGLVS
jgi:gamma-glutamyltranspeptidase / glutathione hydrolase